MNRIAGIALLAVGIALLIWGINANDSVGSAFSRAFSGSPTNKTIWLLAGGGLLTAAGAYVLFFSRKKGK
jgi:LPXTG-motif cell wall-anchored protein